MKRKNQTSRKGFFHFFMKSVVQRTGRIVIAALSVTLAVSIVTGILGITMGIRDKLGSELKAYGANAILSPREGNTLDSEIIGTIKDIEQVEDVTGQVFGRALLDEEGVEIIGLDMVQLKKMGWKLSGRWPEGKNRVLAGMNLKEAFGLELDQAFSVQGEQGRVNFIVSGFTEKGGSEDNALIMSIENAWEVTALPGKLNALLIRGTPGELDNMTMDIEKKIPSVQVKTVRQVAYAEEAFLGKIQLLMILVTTIVLFASGISVASTMGADVLERREEIGLMKAIGATRRDIGIFFVTETGLIGILGGFAGLAIGYIIAQITSKGAFGSFLSFPPYIPFISIVTGTVFSLLAGYFPVRDAMKYNPAQVLRGE
jgi:putative ABC transport system permease protein